MSKASLVQLKGPDWRENVAKTLREIADGIEIDQVDPDTVVIVSLSRGKSPDVYGLGRQSDEMQLLGALTIGQDFLLHCYRNSVESGDGT